MNMTITRFAPSPTGNLHIGGARTALFNWLYARHHAGRFLLRIEDTDRERSTTEAIDAIISGLQWLELDWDGECVHQMQNIMRHTEVCRMLLAEGKAYRCWSSPSEIDEARNAASRAGRPRKFSSPWRDAAGPLPSKSRPHVIRLRVPASGETVVDDRVYGRISWPNREIEDLVILRSDGTPTYNLAASVDDHDMEISHVIRGDDHIANTPKQVLIHTAMGWSLPQFVHVPLIHDEHGRKLSKRHGDAGVEIYREDGYLPEAVRNYLARLGWSHGDDEFFSTSQAVKWFGIDGIRRSPARIDRKKLDSLSTRHLADADAARLWELIDDHIDFTGQVLSPVHRDRLRRGLDLYRRRMATIQRLVSETGYLEEGPPVEYDPGSVGAINRAGAALLVAAGKRLADAEWTKDMLRGIVEDMADEHGLKPGGIAGPLRAALTGCKDTPGAYDMMILLGRSETLERISHAVDVIVQPAG